MLCAITAPGGIGVCHCVARGDIDEDVDGDRYWSQAVSDVSGA